jgi:hypothetical protein
MGCDLGKLRSEGGEVRSWLLLLFLPEIRYCFQAGEEEHMTLFCCMFLTPVSVW